MKTILLATMLSLLCAAPMACGDGAGGKATGGRPPQFEPPPPAALVTASGEQTAGTGSYCWEGLCVDKIGMMIPADAITAETDESLEFNLSTEPVELALAAWPFPSGRVVEEYGEYFAWLPENEPTLRYELPAQVSFQFTPDFPPGRYVVVLDVHASAGSVGYFFLLELAP